MDFDKLIQILPKPSVTWTVDDIQLWLSFIGLSTYAPQFRDASVDGSCLSQLTEQDIRIELKIQSKIITKKILTWITDGVQKYDAFLANRLTTLQKTSQPTLLNSRRFSKESEYISQKKQRMKSEQKWEKTYQLREGTNEKKSKKKESGESEGEEREINQLIIKQCESSIYSCYSLKQQGGMIGRNSKNQIQIIDDNVSRFHAQIQFEDGKYYIRDYGSSSGTFIRITQKTMLNNEQIIQMGSNQFYVDLTNTKILNLKIIQGPNLGEPYSIATSKGKVNVGRKATNEISFPEDQHLSNIHSTIFTVQGIWYIEDLGTTNGTWIRLSPEGVKSQQFVLQNSTQFKLGSSLTYECQLTSFSRKTEKEKSDKCHFCKVCERDCIFIPCKHNVCCFKCSQLNELVHCTSCGSAITDIMKIFKV